MRTEKSFTERRQLEQKRPMKKKPHRIFFLFLISVFLFSCGSDSQKIVGRWEKVKDVLDNGTVVEKNSPYNYYKNYMVDFRSDGKLFIEYDTDQSLGSVKHRQDKGEWKLQKNNLPEFPFLLTVKIIAEDETRESINKVKTLSDKELIFVSQDKHTVYFERK